MNYTKQQIEDLYCEAYKEGWNSRTDLANKRINEYNRRIPNYHFNLFDKMT